jgi:hypothetical protein
MKEKEPGVQAGRTGQAMDRLKSVPWEAWAVLGAIVYGLLRIDYALFYGRFGVAPEEVGLGYFEVLAQSVVGTLMQILLQFLFVLFVVVYASLLWKGLKRIGQRGRGVFGRFKEGAWRSVRYVLHRLLIVAVLVSVVVLLRMVKGTTTIVVVVGAGIALAWLFGLGVENPLRAPDTQPAVEEAPPLWQAVWGEATRFARWALTVSVVGVLLVLLPYWAFRNGTAVQHGESSDLTSFPGAPFFPTWGAQPAVVSWVDGTPPASLMAAQGHCLMYMGSARGTTVLYDVDARQTLRLPSNALAISVAPSANDDRSAC